MVKGYSENTVKILLDLANYLALMKHLTEMLHGLKGLKQTNKKNKCAATND